MVSGIRGSVRGVPFDVNHDLVVIGGGAAGLAAARTARRRGASVAMVTDGPVGGDCTFVGCIPSKTLIEAARRGEGFTTAMAEVRAAVDDIAATETAAVLRSEGVDVIEGRARLTAQGRIDVGGRTVGYRRLVLATGAGPSIPPIAGLAGREVLTNETVFDLTSQPASLLVLGGGPAGVELAQAFARLGTKVTMVEAEGRLLPREEPEASQLVAGALRSDGVVVHTGRSVTSVEPGCPDWTVALDSGASFAVTTILCATGRRPATDGLGLVDGGVVTDGRGYVVTDRHMRTSVAGVYAAGDVTGRAAFTHAADEMGRIAAANALSRAPYRRYRDDCIPAVTFTDPEVARVGLTEDAVAASVAGARVAYLPLGELDRAVTAGRTDGYIKLIAGPRKATRSLAGGRLLGATVVAPHAGEMISVPTLALRTGMLPARLAMTVQAYPTWSLGIRQAAAQLFIESGGRRSRPARSSAASEDPL